MVINTSRRGMALKKSHMEPSTIRLWSRVARMLLAAKAGMSPIPFLRARYSRAANTPSRMRGTTHITRDCTGAPLWKGEKRISAGLAAKKVALIIASTPKAPPSIPP